MLNKLFSAINIDPSEVNVPQGEASGSSIQTILSLVFGLFTAVALLMVVISALRMVLSRGNPEAFAKARDSVIYSVVGLIICFSAFTIVTFVVERI